MYQRDFILRIIEMLAELLAGIMGLIKKGEYEKAEENLENAYQDLLKNEASFFQNIPVEALTDTLLKEHNYTNGHLEVLAELFYMQAELFKAQKKVENSREYYLKSKYLFQFVMRANKTFSLEQQNKLTAIESAIEGFSRPDS